MSKPFGADFVVFIVGSKPLKELHQVLSGLHGQVAPLELYDALRRALPSTTFRIGIQAAYTCERLKENGLCDSMVSASAQ